MIFPPAGGRGGGGKAEKRDSLAGRKTLKADKSFRLPCRTENKCKLRCCRLPKTFDRKGKTTTTPEENRPQQQQQQKRWPRRSNNWVKTKYLLELKLSWLYSKELCNRYRSYKNVNP